MELRGTRLVLRPWLRSDYDAMDAWPPYNDPLDQVWNIPRQSSSTGGWYQGYQASIIRKAWAVDDLQGRLIGRISLREVDERAYQARLGVSFGAPYVGRGLGSEALRLFVDYYFGPLAQRALVLDVAAPNVRAVRCYDRLGFRMVGQEWRDAGYRLDLRFLDLPGYRDLRPFFRQQNGTTWVQFYEMDLHRADWDTWRRREHTPA